MKEKIMNIKNILKIVISIFIIFNMVKGCSKAYTFDDLIGYAEYIKTESNVPTNIKNGANILITRKNFIKTKIQSQYNLNNIKSILCQYDGNVLYILLTFNSGNYNVVNNMINIGSNVYENRFSSNNNSTWYYNGKVGSNVYINKTQYFGLLDNTNEFIDYTGFWLNNMYSTEPKLDFTPNYNISNLNVLSHTGVNGIYSRKLEDPIWRDDK